jgi:hypothetical protein
MKKKAEPTAEEKVVEELVRRAREHGLSLTGPDGLLKQLTKTVLETALNQELTEHLGHDKHGMAGNETENMRNGSRAKTVLTEATGQVPIKVQRERAGTFEPQIVRKRQRRLSGGGPYGTDKSVHIQRLRRPPGMPQASGREHARTRLYERRWRYLHPATPKRHTRSGLLRNAWPLVPVAASGA